MRRPSFFPTRSRAAIVACGLTLMGGAIGASPVDASVPGQSFTQTQCEAYSDSVARLYTAALDREPEQGGFDWWLEEYTQGRWTLPLMAQFFVESPEFQQKYGALDDRAYIAQIYRNVLDREPDGEGLDFWAGQMAGGMTRAILLLRFSESPENITNSGTSQPALGEFNEGRSPGAWVCGPDLMALLPDSYDVSGGWVLRAEDRSDRAPVAGRCEDVGGLPPGTVGRLYTAALGDFTMVIAAYPFATEYGAATFMDATRDGFDGCATFVSNGYEVATGVSAGPNRGDDSLFLTMVSRDPNFGWRSETTYVRVGRLVVMVSTSADSYPAAHQTPLDTVLPVLEGAADW